MKEGRVPRQVRQWGNFTFLMCLFVLAGWITYKLSLQKVMEVPEGYVHVTVTEPLIFKWRDPKITVKKAGKHTATPAEIRGVEEGSEVTYRLGPLSYDVSGVVKTSTTFEGMKATIGLGKKSYAEFSGTMTIDIDENNVKKIVTTKEEEIKEAFAEAVSNASADLRTEDREKFEKDVAEEVQKALGINHVSLALDQIEFKDKAEPTATVALRAGQLKTPTILEEFPTGGYFAIGMVLFLTPLIYALVRTVFDELFGIIFLYPLSLLGVGRYEVHKPGYYPTRRPQRSRPQSGPGIGDALVEVGAMTGDVLSHAHHSGPDLGDVIDTAGEVVGTVADAADIFGGIGEAAGSILDVFGDIF